MKPGKAVVLNNTRIKMNKKQNNIVKGKMIKYEKLWWKMMIQAKRSIGKMKKYLRKYG